MRNKTILTVCTLFLGGASILATVPGYAGYQTDGAASCTMNSDGSGSCFGALPAFRDSADHGAWAGFNVSADVNGAAGDFFAELNGKFYTCSAAPGNGNWAGLEMVTVSKGADFWVFWDSSGTCQNLYVNNLSSHYTAF